MSHGETHFRATKKGRFHDLLIRGNGLFNRREDTWTAMEVASIIPIFIFGETKRLDLRRNQAFHNASGGDKRDRTADLLNAIQALSQLSYTPRSLGAGAPRARSIIAEAPSNVKHYFFLFLKKIREIDRTAEQGGWEL